MSSFRVLVTDYPWPDLKVEQSLLLPHGVEIIDALEYEQESLASLASEVDAIATCWAHVTRAIIEAAPKCRIICRMGIGLDNIDIQAATKHNVIVTNVPDYCISEVADHTLGLILALKRNIGFYHYRIRQFKNYDQTGPKMQRLSTLRLGLVGFGQIGRAVYERALPFGFDLLATSSSRNDYGTGCRMVSMNELLETADIISLHLPLGTETRHLLNQTAFEQMKSGVSIVNTARGGLIDQQALAEAISSGKVAHAGLDVFDPEPPDLQAPIFQNDTVVVTPHTAFVSEEALIELRTQVSKQLLAVHLGNMPAHVVNL